MKFSGIRGNIICRSGILEKKMLYKHFKELDFGGEILLDEPMKNHTSFKIGGPADIMIIPKGEEEIIESIKFCRDNNIKYFIMGNGTNLLVKDSGIRGVVIKIGNGFNHIRVVDNRIICQSGGFIIHRRQASIEKFSDRF